MTRKSKPPVAIYSALADTTRCRIIEILLPGPMPVHTLAGAFTISRPAISRHLRVLKTAGLVAEVKKGRENLYTLKAAKLSKALDWIENLSPITESIPPEPVIVAEPTADMPVEIPPPAARAKKQPDTKPDPLNQMGFDF